MVKRDNEKSNWLKTLEGKGIEELSIEISINKIVLISILSERVNYG